MPIGFIYNKEQEADKFHFCRTKSAVVATTVALFLMVFRPFQISSDSLAEVLIIIGTVPLNFLAMFTIHYTPLSSSRMRAIFGALLIVFANSVYFAYWSQTGLFFGIAAEVTLVGGLAIGIVALWNRGRPRYYKLEQKHAEFPPASNPIVLRGANDREILRLAPDELTYLCANGNYVDVHYLKCGTPAKTMLRASLVSLVAQVKKNTLTQCHRSYFVNLTVAQRIVSERGHVEIEYHDGVRVPVSRKYRVAIINAVTS